MEFSGDMDFGYRSYISNFTYFRICRVWIWSLFLVKDAAKLFLTFKTILMDLILSLMADYI